MRHRFLPMIGLLGGGALLLAPAIANAQAADPVGGEGEAGAERVDEIVVTVLKTRTSLQKVPAAVTAFDASALEAASIDNVRDVSLSIPNMNITQAQQPGILLINVRGVGQVRNGEPPVAVVIDGVQLNNVNQFSQDLLDIERIEVLKGPQGSIYGRNAIGGAINIVTKGPTDTFTGTAEAFLGTGLDMRGQVAISGPIAGEKLMFRLSGAFRDFDGDIYNQTLRRDVNQETSNTVRLALLSKLSDELTIDIRGSRTENHSGAAYYSFVPPTASRLDVLPITANLAGKVDRRIYDLSIKIDYDLAFAKLTAISGYTNTRFDLFQDFDFLPADLLSGAQNYRGRTWSQELRLAGNSGPLNWLVGGYVLKTKETLRGGVFARPGASGVLFPFPIPAPIRLNGPNIANDNLAYAAFGNFAYKVTPRFEATLGLRYDVDERDYLNRSPTPPLELDKSFKSFQPKLTLTYSAGDRAILYASAGKGFRSGGFNPNARLTQTFKAEENVSYEVGAKTSWFDGRLTLNGAGFYTRIKDRQVYIYDNLTGAQTITNPIPRSRILGVEADLTARPAPGLDLSLSGGLLDTKITRYDTTLFAGLPAAGDFTGNDLPQTPNWSYAAAIQYRFALTDGLRLTPRAEVTGKGRFYWEVDNRDRQPAVSLVNLRLTAEVSRLKLTGFVENLFDKVYIVDVVAQRFSGAPLGNYNLKSFGRRYGAKARVDF
jgi:iron complex outermembrane recepter protein